MKILLDECLPKRLAGLIQLHEVITVPQMGWAGVKNGKLLALAKEVGFDVFITVDGNLTYQQNLKTTSGLAILVLAASTNRFQDLAPLVPQIQAALAQNLFKGDIKIIKAGS